MRRSPLNLIFSFIIVGLAASIAGGCDILESSDSGGFTITITNRDSVDYDVRLNDRIIGQVTTSEPTGTFPNISDSSILAISPAGDTSTSLTFPDGQQLYVIHSSINVTIDAGGQVSVVTVTPSDTDATEGTD